MMFSSDQRFLISGDKKENLIEALKCALTLCGELNKRDTPDCTGVGSYCIRSEYGLIFGNSYSTEHDGDFIKYPMPMTLNMVVEHAMQYLESADAAQARRTNPSQFEGGDGGVRKGWEVYIPDWAYFRSIIAVRPSWTYYSK